MKKLSTLILALSALHVSPTFAAMIGTEGGNGGDTCENRFKVVRDDLGSWIKLGGSAGLALPGIRLDDYDADMLSAIDGARVSCTDDKVIVRGEEKTCKNFEDEAGEKRILCNNNRFLSSEEAEQYVLVHHEFAGLAGFEVDGADGSCFTISNQITGYLEDQLVKRLVVNPFPPSGFKALPLRSESINVGAFTSAEDQFAIYKRLLARAGRVVKNIQLAEENSYGHLFGIKFDHIASRSLRCHLAALDVGAGMFESIEEKIKQQFRLLDVSDDRWVDMEIISTRGGGIVNGIRVHYCQ